MRFLQTYKISKLVNSYKFRYNNNINIYMQLHEFIVMKHVHYGKNFSQLRLLIKQALLCISQINKNICLEKSHANV